MNQRVLEYIRQKNMVKQGEVVLVGVSGGADSVCLLLLLKELEQELKIQVRVIHVEHGIRGEESLMDASFVQNLCERKKIPFSLHQVDVLKEADRLHKGIEETARILRYEVFQKEALQCQQQEEVGVCVALAHHREDNAETMLFHMIRGSGISGLCGMPPVRTETGVRYIRPLLGESRKNLENYLLDKGQEWRQDGTNTLLEYSRNRLRHEIFPVLSEMNSQAVFHMNQLAEQLMSVRDFLQEHIDIEIQKRLTETSNRVVLQTKDWEKLHPVIGDELIRYALVLAAGKQKDLTSVHVKKIRELVQQQSGKKVSLPYGITVRREYENLLFLREREKRQQRRIEVLQTQLEKCLKEGTDYRIPVEKDQEFVIRIFPNNGHFHKIMKKTYTKWFDYDMIKSSLFIRHRESGDFFCIDLQGHHKKLKQVLIDEKVPQSQRDSIWMLAEGNKILWQVGGRISEDVKVSEETSYILEIRFLF